MPATWPWRRNARRILHGATDKQCKRNALLLLAQRPQHETSSKCKRRSCLATAMSLESHEVRSHTCAKHASQSNPRQQPLSPDLMDPFLCVTPTPHIAGLETHKIMPAIPMRYPRVWQQCSPKQPRAQTVGFFEHCHTRAGKTALSPRVPASGEPNSPAPLCRGRVVGPKDVRAADPERRTSRGGPPSPGGTCGTEMAWCETEQRKSKN